MLIFRFFIILFSLLLLACGPREDSLEGKFALHSKQVEKNPDDPVGHYELGKVYIEKEEYQAAFNQLSEATRLKGDYGEAYREKGIAQFYLKHFLDAEKSLEKSFRLNPTQPDIATDLGSIYLKNGNMKNAFRYLKIAQTRNNNAHIVFNNLGAAHAKTGKNKEALAAYQKALELDDSNAMAHYNLGVIYAKEKASPKAIEEWETAIRLDSKDENILNSLAWAYEKLGKKKEALVKLDQSIKLSPYDPKAHFSLGRIKHDLRDSDGAIDSLKKATRLDPNFGDAYYRLGLAYDSQNQSYDSISSLMIAEIIYHKTRKTDLLEKTLTEMKSLFEKYQVQRSDFRDLQVPETLKGYDLHQRPNQIRTSKQK